MKKLLLTLTLLLCSVITHSQTIEFTIMHASGGVSDIVSRYIIKEMPKRYNAVNRPGAGGKIAINHLLNENTLMLATMVQVYGTNPLNFEDYDTKKLDVIANVGIMPSALLCHKKTGYETFKDFQSSIKTISFGVGGYGSNEHIATEVLIEKTRVKSIVVPYAQGGTTAINDLLGGHIDCMFGNYPTIRAHIANTNLRLLLTSHNLVSNTTTWDSIFNSSFPLQSYLSIVISAATPDTLRKQYIDDLQSAFKEANFNTGLADLGLFPKTSVDPRETKKSIEATESIKRFILANKLKTTG
jgi:tripartite-type tricarboxylate transporter receptor subunit TctC